MHSELNLAFTPLLPWPALALLAVAAWNLFQGNLPAAAGLAANAFLAFALFYTNYYLNSTYRTSGDFAKLAVADVANASAVVVNG